VRISASPDQSVPAFRAWHVARSCQEMRVAARKQGRAMALGLRDLATKRLQGDDVGLGAAATPSVELVDCGDFVA